MSLFSELRERAVKHAQYRQTVRELSAMTPAEAEDIGVNRWDIERIARTAVYG